MHFSSTNLQKSYELRYIVSSDTNWQSMGKRYLLGTCNDRDGSRISHDFYFHITTVVVDNYKEMVS